MKMAEARDDLEAFRVEARAWLAENFPKKLVGRASDYMVMEGAVTLEGDALAWRQRLGEQGWGTPTWPKEYGGAGLNQLQSRVVQEEMAAVGAFNPIPMLAGMGVTMVGPTILEYGTDDQKQRHLPPIARGECRWCLGYSEPNAGSDLASLATKAEDVGDHWVLNGQKVWTSGADISDWCGALVRTDSKVGKRDGISFVMLTMDQPGVQTRPIKLISGASPFCETFFNNARAEKADLLGKLNDGWSVGKRLLQHERASQTGGNPVAAGRVESLQDIAKRYVGADAEGRLADPDLRMRIVNHLMGAKAHGLTLARIAAEARGNAQVTAAASILKNSATAVAESRSELTLDIMGHKGVGWDGDEFTGEEVQTVRNWLFGKAMSIYGGSFEIQNNIISKNILGLPEHTQKG
jgi:alkylation response protein AidB-like acyl-CoA dehydrogenase